MASPRQHEKSSASRQHRTRTSRQHPTTTQHNAIIIKKKNTNTSALKIEDFIETHHRKLCCVILRSRVARVWNYAHHGSIPRDHEDIRQLLDGSTTPTQRLYNDPNTRSSLHHDTTPTTPQHNEHPDSTTEQAENQHDITTL